MKDWRKEFQRYWMLADSKPKGRMRKFIESKVRLDGKKQIKDQLDPKHKDED